VHPKLARRAVIILKDKLQKEGSEAATTYVKRLCHGADGGVWEILREAQAKHSAEGWDMGLDT
jgi:hypothetical protein